MQTALATLFALVHHTELLQTAQIENLVAGFIHTGGHSVLQKILEQGNRLTINSALRSHLEHHSPVLLSRVEILPDRCEDFFKVISTDSRTTLESYS